MAKEFTIAKHEKEEDWAKSKYIPKAGEFIVFEYDTETPKLKVGDGVTNVNDLPFLPFSNPQVSEDRILTL